LARVKESLGPTASGRDEWDARAEAQAHLADTRQAEADERDRRADERDRIADQREVDADIRERLADEREKLVDGRERLIEARESMIEARTSQNRGVAEGLVQVRLTAAERAERIADQAESYAAYLEGTADRGDREQRLKLAGRERDIAAVERRNAARLRDLGTTPLRLESLPRFSDDGGTDAYPGGRA
jgi:DNA repair exonuclease SbcCD ATPase subunit